MVVVFLVMSRLVHYEYYLFCAMSGVFFATAVLAVVGFRTRFICHQSVNWGSRKPPSSHLV